MGCTNLGPLWAASNSTSMSSNGGVYEQVGVIEQIFAIMHTDMFSKVLVYLEFCKIE